MQVDDVTTAFASAHDLLRWAIEDLHEFEDLGEQFMRSGPFRLWRELNEAEETYTYKIHVEEPPDRLRKLATHALWGIKHAADHAARAAVLMVTGEDPGDVYFPIGSHPNDLRARVRGPRSKYPPDMQELFEGFAAHPTGDGYAGGNDQFCELNKLANSTKHAISLATVPSMRIARAKMVGMIGGARIYPVPLRSGRNEYLIGTLPADPHAKVDMEFAAFIELEGSAAITGRPAGEVIYGYAEMVGLAIDVLEAEAFRVTSRMG